jgi:Flp pilus assembly protein CpaB
VFASLRQLVPRRALRLGRFPRLCAVGICLLLAAQSAVAHRAARPAGGRTVPVLVSARTLPAGHVLSAGDLRQARWPAADRPPGAPAAPAAVVGRRLAGPMGVGEPITGTRLIGRDLTAGLSGDLVAAAVPLADPHAVELVRPGDRIELLSTRRTDDLSAPGPGRIEELAADARVLAVLAGSDDGAELVVAVSRPVAGRIVRDGPTHVFTAVLAPP